MKILIFDAGSYVYYDIVDCLKEMGHEVHTIFYHFADRFEDSYFEESFTEKVKEASFSAIFSVNFFPLVANIANDLSIPYLSWSYDSPLAEKLTEYFSFETNKIFLFDRNETEKYTNQGFSNIYHMPLAANANRLDKMCFSQVQEQRFSADVSFVGQLYSEPILSRLLSSMDDYSKGYIEAIMSAQMQVYGADILTPAISEDLLDRIHNCARENGVDSVLSKTGLTFSIQKQITCAERITLISTLGEYYDLKYFGTDKYAFDSRVKKMGPVHYMDEMPAVFRYSKINLCPTIRSIVTGIPLRALDIMASGGVLFSNYQVELAEMFGDGEDCIMYSSLEEAVDKASYYLNNEEELCKIAQNGHDIVKKNFRYEDRIRTLLSFL